jgi:hypothetical protein
MKKRVFGARKTQKKNFGGQKNIFNTLEDLENVVYKACQQTVIKTS